MTLARMIEARNLQESPKQVVVEDPSSCALMAISREWRRCLFRWARRFLKALSTPAPAVLLPSVVSLLLATNGTTILLLSSSSGSSSECIMVTVLVREQESCCSRTFLTLICQKIESPIFGRFYWSLSSRNLCAGISVIIESPIFGRFYFRKMIWPGYVPQVAFFIESPIFGRFY